MRDSVAQSGRHTARELLGVRSMKKRDIVLAFVSGVAYFGYGGMVDSLSMQVQAVFLIAAFGVATAILQLVGKEIE
jgi:hypothetical protein